MNRKRRAELIRFSKSTLIALPVTVALIFLMTRLIVPSEQDRVISRMIQNIEFQRAETPPLPVSIRVFEWAPLPITNSVQGTSPLSQEDVTGYLNSFGDLEFKISENCTIQTLVSARLDISDFTEKLPMRVMCKPARNVRYSFDRHESE